MKPTHLRRALRQPLVAPPAGAWIETTGSEDGKPCKTSGQTHIDRNPADPLPIDSCKRMPEIDLGELWDRLPESVRSAILEAVKSRG